MRRTVIRRATAFVLAALGAAFAIPSQRSAPALAANRCNFSSVGQSTITYDPTASTANTSSSTISVTCSSGTPTVTVKATTGSSGFFFVRAAAGSFAGTLYYNLYKAGCSTVWGDGTSGSQTISQTIAGDNNPHTVSFCVKIPASQSLGPGLYTDTITLTLVDGVQTSTQAMTFSARVNGSCNSPTVTPLAFGSYGLGGANLDQSTTFSLTCTAGTTISSILLDNGQNASGSQRRLASGSNYLQYGLYSDAARTTAWNATTYPASTSYTAQNTNPVSFSIYGRVPSGQHPFAGSYTDVVTITVNFL